MSRLHRGARIIINLPRLYRGTPKQAVNCLCAIHISNSLERQDCGTDMIMIFCGMVDLSSSSGVYSSGDHDPSINKTSQQKGCYFSGFRNPSSLACQSLHRPGDFLTTVTLHAGGSNQRGYVRTVHTTLLCCLYHNIRFGTLSWKY